MTSKKKYKLQIFFSLLDENFPQGKELEYESANEAFFRAILLLKVAVKGDFILAKKFGNSTIVHFIDDPALQVRITPNILAKGNEQIGPYSFEYGMMLSEFPEN